MKKQLICISCPIGCELNIEYDADFKSVVVTGNNCPRGERYAKQELTNPARVVTAVVKTVFPNQPYIPVRTNKELPKKFIPSLLNELYKMEIKSAAKRGDLLIENFQDSNVDVILSSSIY